MRRAVVLVAVLALAMGIGMIPASATHCGTGNATSCPNPLTIAVLQGQGSVCTQSGMGSCIYHTDALWSGSTAVAQGLYCPTRGPAAGDASSSVNPHGAPFSFSAGPGLNTGTLNSCFSNVGLQGCQFISSGQLGPGKENNLGAYAFSSQGKGTSTFTAPATPANAALTVVATFGWSGSAGTILPLQGTVLSTTPGGGAGATVIGFVSARSFQGGGTCGAVDQADPTRVFQTEGMVVTF